MAPRKAAAVPKKQSTLFEFGGKEAFKLKIYQHVLREHQEEEEEEDEEDDADIEMKKPQSLPKPRGLTCDANT